MLNTIVVAVPGGAPATFEELARAAEDGDPEAELALGMRYRDGEGVARDYQIAIKWYRRCADRGNADGMDNVGFMHLRGWGVPENFDVAAAYFKSAARMNHSQALFNLGNCYFSGQGVERDYPQAIGAWERAAAGGHRHSIWRLATLLAAGEGIGKDRARAKQLCESIAGRGDVNGMLLLGELCSVQGEQDQAKEWWSRAAEAGSIQAKALLKLGDWRHEDSRAGQLGYVELDHLYQGWNNCGATSVAMLARHSGADVTPYDLKRLCPRSPIGTGTDWADLVAAGDELDQRWEMIAFADDDAGFASGVAVIRQHLDANRPVVIDFTVTRELDGRTEHFGHTLLVVGYNADLDQFVLKNPNQPPPGIQLMSGEQLKSNWGSRGYSRLAKGQRARPLIVLKAN
ncbi:MAG: C39 family peptidase [Verrucomicrobiales bacterium]